MAPGVPAREVARFSSTVDDGSGSRLLPHRGPKHTRAALSGPRFDVDYEA